MDEIQFLKLDIMSWAEGHRFWRSVQGFESDFDLPLRYFRGLKVFNLIDHSSSEYDTHSEGLAIILFPRYSASLLQGAAEDLYRIQDSDCSM
jgi:hypothetical protein